METKLQRPKDSDGALPSLNAAINTLDIAKDKTSVKPVKDVFSSAGILLNTIRVSLIPTNVSRLPADVSTQDSMIKDADCVELGLTCADVCQVLDRRINGRRQEQISQSALQTIERLKV